MGIGTGYAPDPAGADIPALIIPKNCCLPPRLSDPSGANFDKVLVNLCRLSDSVTVTGLRARPKCLVQGLEPPSPVPCTGPAPAITPISLRRDLSIGGRLTTRDMTRTSTRKRGRSSANAVHFSSPTKRSSRYLEK